MAAQTWTRYIVSTTLFTTARSKGARPLGRNGARLSRGAFHPKEPDLGRLGCGVHLCTAQVMFATGGDARRRRQRDELEFAYRASLRTI